MKNGLAILVMLLCAPTAQAQIYELAFTDTNDATVVKSPSLTWYNPKGTITVTHIAGLDRKVKLELLQGTTVVSTQTSSLLTVANRITASDGQAFYGVKFTLPKPADGNHVLRSTVFDINGNQVSTNSNTFNVDTVVPNAGNFVWGFNYGGGTAPDGLPMFSPVEARLFALDGVQDAASGINGVTYSATYKYGANEGKTYSSGATSYDSSTLRAALGNGGYNSGAGVIAPSNIQGKMGVTFVAKDKAGNQLSKSMDYYVNSACGPKPVLVALQDPTYSGSVVIAGVTKTGFRAIDSDGPTPINGTGLTAIYRIERSAYRNISDGALYGGVVAGAAMTLIGTDDIYAYFSIVGTFDLSGTIGWSDIGWTNFSTYRCHPMAAPAPQFADATYPPSYVSVNAYIDGIGWVGGSYGGTRDTLHDVAITQVKYTVAARDYVQTITGMLSGCEVPAGETSCTATGSYGVNTEGTVGCHNSQNRARRKDNTALAGTPAYNLWHWDAQPPKFGELISHATNSKTVVFTGVEQNSGGCWNQFHMSSGGLTAKAGSTSISINGSIISGSGNDSTFTASYASLPDGVYDIYAWVKDAYLNTTESSKLFSVTNDSTAPAIAFNYNGAAVPAGINKITDLRVILTDTVDSAPLVTAMTLAGGPINDALQLGFSKQSNGWAPEVPRMFPTLEAGQEYTITVTAKDAQGNSTTKSQKFGLTPANLLSLADIKTFAVAQNLKNKSDVPLALVKFKGALTDGQTQSRGNQSGYITLRSDSAFAVIFNGLLVQPGETKDVVIPLDAAGQASLPIYPATSGVAGKSSYMIDIPQLTVN